MLRAFYLLCWKWCMVDAYLETCRGHMVEAANDFNRAEYWFGKMQRHDLNRRYAKG